MPIIEFLLAMESKIYGLPMMTDQD